MPGCMRRGCLTIRRGCGAVAAVVFSPGWRRRLRAGAGRTGVRIRFPYVVPRPKNVQERGTVRIIGTAGTDLIWFHCASLGEFEQGRPVIEAFRAAHPGWKILLTFFSPSGYEVRKNYAGADYIFYLPADTPAQCPAVRFDFPSEDRRIRQIRVLGQLPVRIAAQRCAGLPDLRDFPARAVVF